MNRQVPRQIHLVGSVPLASATAVFECVGSHLGSSVARIPDGETGERARPFFLRPNLTHALFGARGVERIGEYVIAGYTIPLQGLAAGAKPDDIDFGPLGFAHAAKSSFSDFKRLQAAGRIPQGVRMQVCLPTPFMLGIIFVAPNSLRQLWPAYERAMLRELDDILSSIPHEELAIQWDMSPEIHEVLEKRNLAVVRNVPREMLVAAIARITDYVPLPVEVGWHLCYGDTGHEEGRETKHVVEPVDMGVMTRFANDIFAARRRPINWVHMPVPRGRDDEAYFAPLKNLRVKPEMRLFLGLVHLFDGIEGGRRRAAAARTVYPDFGVATECGMGRRPPESIPALLDLHLEIAHLT